MDDVFSEIPKKHEWILQAMKNEGKNIVSEGEIYFKATSWGDYRFIPYFEAETARKAYEETDIYKDTVLLVSFPKTGTNWAMEIVRQILYGDDEKLNAISKSVPPILMTILETWRHEKFKLLKRIQLPKKIIYTHLPEELMNFETLKKCGTKVIVLVRNPKDQAVSWFHFSKNRSFDPVRDELSPCWDQFYADYIAGKHRLMTRPGEFYPEFLLGWHKHKEEENVKFLTFESLKKDCKTEIKDLAEFLGVELSEKRVSEIVEGTSFEVMKKTQSAETSDAQKVQSNLNMLRRGQVGGWKDYFTVAQSEQMDQIFDDRLANTDIKFIYE